MRLSYQADSVTTRVSLAYARLTRTERKVADVLLADPGEFARTPMARIEARSGVSPPSIMRFCRALGYAGLTDLKFALAATGAVAGEEDRATRAGGPGCDAARILDRCGDVIERLRSHLDEDAIDTAAAILAGAPRIRCLASWQLGLAARYARDAFLRQGLAAVVPSEHPMCASGDEEAGAAAGLFLCHGMPDTAMFDALARCQRAGVRTVILGDIALPAFVPADTSLVIGPVDAPDGGAGALLAYCLAVDILLARMASPGR